MQHHYLWQTGLHLPWKHIIEVWKKIALYCEDHNFRFPTMKSSELAEYLMQLAQTLERPKSLLNTSVAVLTCLCDAMNVKTPITQEITKLVVGLVKSCTLRPLKRSTVMPVEPFIMLFHSWQGNWFLTLTQLRMKCLTLLVLSMMLRPSDVASKATVFDKEKQELSGHLVLSTDDVQFNLDGSVSIMFHRSKNDYSGDGFEVNVPPAKEIKVDPVETLRCYIERTRYQRSIEKPLFISVRKPFKPLSASGVAKILESAIMLAGLANKGYSAKSFHPTGTTVAIEQGLDPDSVSRQGHWKSKETFEYHYVHAKPHKDFANRIYGLSKI